MDPLCKKFHLTMTITAAIAVLLLYTTEAIALIGAATGISLGLSIRLYLLHQKTAFASSAKLDWVLLIIATGTAFVLMLLEAYDVQAIVLIFVAVRTLFMYFTLSSSATESGAERKAG